MQFKVLLVFIAAVVGLVCGEISEHDRKVLDSAKDVANKTKEEIAHMLENKTDAVQHKWDIVHDLLEDGDLDGDFDGELANETVTEFMGIDETGCDRKLKKHFEDRCDETYEKVSDEAQAIKDEKNRTEALCCALEDFEKCSLKAFDQASCVTDKEAIRENMKAARLFLTVISGITCSEFRGQCVVYHSESAATIWYSSYVMILLSLGAHIMFL